MESIYVPQSLPSVSTSPISVPITCRSSEHLTSSTLLGNSEILGLSSTFGDCKSGSLDNLAASIKPNIMHDALISIPATLTNSSNLENATSTVNSLKELSKMALTNERKAAQTPESKARVKLKLERDNSDEDVPPRPPLPEDVLRNLNAMFCNLPSNQEDFSNRNSRNTQKFDAMEQINAEEDYQFSLYERQLQASPTTSQVEEMLDSIDHIPYDIPQSPLLSHRPLPTILEVSSSSQDSLISEENSYKSDEEKEVLTSQILKFFSYSNSHEHFQSLNMPSTNFNACTDELTHSLPGNNTLPQSEIDDGENINLSTSINRSQDLSEPTSDDADATPTEDREGRITLLFFGIVEGAFLRI